MDENKTIFDELTAANDAPAIEKAIEQLKKKRDGDLPDVDTLKNQLDPAGHAVMDENIRKNKKVQAGEFDEADGGSMNVTKNGKTSSVKLKIEKVSRIALGYQQLIINRAVAFCFGNAVNYNTNTEDKSEISVHQAVERILYDNKEKYFNREIARELFAFTEVAEVWFPVPVDQPHNSYGFPSNFKLKCVSLKPSENMELYPYFDRTGNMEAFSRAYKIKEDDNDVEYFETYTETQIFKWKKTDGWETVTEEVNGTTVTYPTKNPVGKIPVVYARQQNPEWYLVQNIIESDEELRSNFSDTNKYHSSPTVVAKGKINGFAKKGEAGKIIEVAENADVKYLEWSNAAQSVEAEHKMNREDIFSITQTPDTSFDSVKGIGNLSGISQKMLFFDAHLKVMDKEEILGEYLQRRVNVIKAFVAQFNTGLAAAAESVMITPEITPYMIGDDSETIANVVTAVHGGVMSKKTGVKALDWVTDTEAELKQIQEEELQSAAVELFPQGK